MSEIDIPPVEDNSPAEVKRVRPLNATQTRNLLKLIEGDYENLRNEVVQFARDQIAAKEQEIRASATWQQRDALVEESQELYQKWRAEREEYIAKCRAVGFSVEWNALSGVPKATLSDRELERRIKVAREEINAEKDTALLALNRKENEAKRKILIASITAEAEAVINAIPNAQEAMLEAAQERAQKLAQIGGPRAT